MDGLAATKTEDTRERKRRGWLIHSFSARNITKQGISLFFKDNAIHSLKLSHPLFSPRHLIFLTFLFSHLRIPPPLRHSSSSLILSPCLRACVSLSRVSFCSSPSYSRLAFCGEEKLKFRLYFYKFSPKSKRKEKLRKKEKKLLLIYFFRRRRKN